jgi:hypothetical protein
MPRWLCALLNHPGKYNTGNKIGKDFVIRCNRCDRAWFGEEEILPYVDTDGSSF